MFLSRPFLTTERTAQGTNGATAGITPTPANVFTIQTNTSQIIVHNTDGAQTLYFLAYNASLDAAVDLAEMIEVTAGAYLTISMGVRSESVGIRKMIGMNISASATKFKVTEILNIEE